MEYIHILAIARSIDPLASTEQMTRRAIQQLMKTVFKPSGGSTAHDIIPDVCTPASRVLQHLLKIRKVRRHCA